MLVCQNAKLEVVLENYWPAYLTHQPAANVVLRCLIVQPHLFHEPALLDNLLTPLIQIIRSRHHHLETQLL